MESRFLLNNWTHNKREKLLSNTSTIFSISVSTKATLNSILPLETVCLKTLEVSSRKWKEPLKPLILTLPSPYSNIVSSTMICLLWAMIRKRHRKSMKLKNIMKKFSQKKNLKKKWNPKWLSNLNKWQVNPKLLKKVRTVSQKQMKKNSIKWGWI